MASVAAQALGVGRPLISRSIAKIASIRRTASSASGALATSASTKNLRRPWLQHAASVIGPGLRAWIVEVVEPRIRIGLEDSAVPGEVSARMLAGAVA